MQANKQKSWRIINADTDYKLSSSASGSRLIGELSGQFIWIKADQGEFYRKDPSVGWRTRGLWRNTSITAQWSEAPGSRMEQQKKKHWEIFSI